MSTILFGSTVEFEMAILTMAFLAGGDVCPFSLHTHTCIQRNTCMHARGREREFIGDYLTAGGSWMHASKSLDVAPCDSSTDMYNNDVGQESAQKCMKQTGDLKTATLYFAS